MFVLRRHEFSERQTGRRARILRDTRRATSRAPRRHLRGAVTALLHGKRVGAEGLVREERPGGGEGMSRSVPDRGAHGDWGPRRHRRGRRGVDRAPGEGLRGAGFRGVWPEGE